MFMFSSDLCKALPGKQLFYRSKKRHIMAKNAFLFRPTGKTNKWAGNMLIFHVDVNMKRLGIRLKNVRFSDSESTLSFERQ